MMKKILTLIITALMLVQAFALPSFAEDTITIAFDGAYSDDTLPGTKLGVICEDVSAMGDVKYYLNGEEVQATQTDDGFTVESVAGKNEIQVKVFSGDDYETPIMTSNVITKEFANLEKVKTFSQDDFTFDGTSAYDTTQFFNVSLASGEFENVDNTLKITATERRTIGLPGESAKWTFQNELSKGGCMYLTYDIKTDMAARKRLLYVDTKKGNVDSFINGPFLEKDGSLTGLPASYAKLRNFDFTGDEWHNVEIVVDVANLIYDVYIDNIQVVTDGVMDANSGTPGYVYIAQNWDRVQSEYYLDNVEISQLAKSYTITPYTEINGETIEGLSDFPLSGGCAKFVFSETMPAFVEDNVTFTVDGKDADFDFYFDTDENAACITPLAEFSGREECRVSFANMKSNLGASSFGDRTFVFNVCPPIFGIATSEISVSSETSTLDAQIVINNLTEDDKNASVLICIYKDSKLIKTYSKSIQAFAGTGAECEIEGALPEGFTEGEFEFVTYLMDKDTFFAVDYIKGV
ncbi:MAG: hypothetical protein E7394_05955 [Ruminococcaceae bacterium]|nr:hypothetical protein [Oscillospiraceae bacterium]